MPLNVNHMYTVKTKEKSILLDFIVASSHGVVEHDVELTFTFSSSCFLWVKWYVTLNWEN